MTTALARKPAPAVVDMTPAQLADEHRGCTMGEYRYKRRREEVEAELDRRKLASAEGERAIVSKQIGDIGLVDFKRLRADLGEGICREYAVPGSREFWRSIDKQRD